MVTLFFLIQKSILSCKNAALSPPVGFGVYVLVYVPFGHQVQPLGHGGHPEDRDARPPVDEVRQRENQQEGRLGVAHMGDDQP